MADSDNELGNRLNKIIKPKTASLSKNKHALMLRLQDIAQKATSGRATLKDLEEARSLNESLGGIYSYLIATIENTIQVEENKKTQTATVSVTGEAVTSATDYFNREEVKQVHKTIEDIELGKEISYPAYLQMLKLLTSDAERALREKTIKDLEEEKSQIFKSAILKNEGKISEEGKARLAQIDTQKLGLIKDQARDRVTSPITEKYQNTPAFDASALAKKNLVTDALFKFKINGIEMFEGIEKVIAKETHELITYVESHTKGTTNIDDMQNNLKAIDIKMNAAKNEIKQIDVVAAKEQEIVNKKEDLSLTLTNAKTEAEKEKDKDKTKNEASMAEKLAAKEAKKALPKRAIINLADIEQEAVGASIRPMSTPPTSALKKAATFSKS